MIQFPNSDSNTSMGGSNAALQGAMFGSNLLNSLFNAFKQNDESEMRSKALQDAQLLLRQRELENQIKEKEAFEAQQDIKNPERQKWRQSGYIGQMQTQDASGRLAQGTLPNKLAAENQSLLNNFNKSVQEGEIFGLDKQMGAETDPTKRALLGAKRKMLVEQLRDTPEQAGKVQLHNLDNASREKIAALHVQALKEKLESSNNKPLTMVQLEASMRKRLAEDPTDEVAIKFLDELERYKRSINPSSGDVTIDPQTKQLVTKGGNAASTRPRFNTDNKNPAEVALPKGWTIK